MCKAIILSIVIVAALADQHHVPPLPRQIRSAPNSSPHGAPYNGARRPGRPTAVNRPHRVRNYEPKPPQENGPQDSYPLGSPYNPIKYSGPPPPYTRGGQSVWGSFAAPAPTYKVEQPPPPPPPPQAYRPANVLAKLPYGRAHMAPPGQNYPNPPVGPPMGNPAFQVGPPMGFEGYPGQRSPPARIMDNGNSRPAAGVPSLRSGRPRY